MTSFTDKIVILLSDGIARDALTIAKLLLGSEAKARMINPTLYELMESGLIYKSNKGDKPMWYKPLVVDKKPYLIGRIVMALSDLTISQLEALESDLTNDKI